MYLFQGRRDGLNVGEKKRPRKTLTYLPPVTELSSNPSPSEIFFTQILSEQNISAVQYIKIGLYVCKTEQEFFLLQYKCVENKQKILKSLHLFLLIYLVLISKLSLLYCRNGILSHLEKYFSLLGKINSPEIHKSEK